MKTGERILDVCVPFKHALDPCHAPPFFVPSLGHFASSCSSSSQLLRLTAEVLPEETLNEAQFPPESRLNKSFDAQRPHEAV